MKVLTTDDFKIESTYEDGEHIVSYVLKRRVKKYIFGIFPPKEVWEYMGYHYGEDNWAAHDFPELEKAKQYIKDYIKHANAKQETIITKL